MLAAVGLSILRTNAAATAVEYAVEKITEVANPVGGDALKIVRVKADETGFEKPIDLNFEAVMADMEDVRKALREKGLILEKRQREMKVLVIRDTNDKEVNQNKQ